ncbi:unnamed protein product, partial [Ixodes pacificus]
VAGSADTAGARRGRAVPGGSGAVAAVAGELLPRRGAAVPGRGHAVAGLDLPGRPALLRGPRGRGPGPHGQPPLLAAVLSPAGPSRCVCTCVQRWERLSAQIQI